MPRFGIKNGLFAAFAMEFENSFVIFEISTLEFV